MSNKKVKISFMTDEGQDQFIKRMMRNFDMDKSGAIRFCIEFTKVATDSGLIKSMNEMVCTYMQKSFKETKKGL